MGQLSAGDSVDVYGTVIGDAIQGNPVWYQIRSNGQRVYVHSSVLSATRPGAVVPAPANNSSSGSSSSGQSGSPFGCNGINDLDCVDFYNIGQNANAHLAQCGDEDHLDGDGDGRACERGY